MASYKAVYDKFILTIGDRLSKAGLKDAEISSDFDLLGSGIIDSFEFIQLITDLCSSLELDFDLSIIDDADLQTMGSIVSAIVSQNNEQSKRIEK